MAVAVELLVAELTKVQWVEVHNGHKLCKGMATRIDSWLVVVGQTEVTQIILIITMARVVLSPTGVVAIQVPVEAAAPVDISEKKAK